MPGVKRVRSYNIQPRPCEHCGKDFKPRSDFIRKGKGGRFCSRLCSQTWESLRKPNQDEKFWSKVKMLSEDECWEFQGFLNGDGYGMCRINNKMERSHQYAFKSKNGPLIKGLEVLHSCDNRPCCNPRHLSLGTHDQNMKQMAERKRSGAPKGERHHKATITEQQAILILKEFDLSKGYSFYAGLYKTSDDVIKNLILGNTWKHIPRQNG